jgi:dienelactone hydrolase
MDDSLNDFRVFEFAPGPGAPRRTVYFKGEGPGVLIMHELPGLSPQCLDLGRRIAGNGFTVFLPLFFGRVGEHSILNIRFCIAGTFSLWASSIDEPLLNWLRALAREIHGRCGGNGMAAIGLCLTGGFALALLVEPGLMAAVTSEPARPAMPVPGYAARIDLSAKQWQEACDRARRDNIPTFGTRFTCDKKSPAQRFETIARGLGGNFRCFPIDTSPGNAYDIPASAHSVLTDHFVDEPEHPTRKVFDELIRFLHERLTL